MVGLAFLVRPGEVRRIASPECSGEKSLDLERRMMPVVITSSRESHTPRFRDELRLVDTLLSGDNPSKSPAANTRTVEGWIQSVLDGGAFAKSEKEFARVTTFSMCRIFRGLVFMKFAEGALVDEEAKVGSGDSQARSFSSWVIMFGWAFSCDVSISFRDDVDDKRKDPAEDDKVRELAFR